MRATEQPVSTHSIRSASAAVRIVGGGQLSRRIAERASRLGLRAVVMDPDPACLAAHQIGSEGS